MLPWTLRSWAAEINILWATKMLRFCAWRENVTFDHQFIHELRDGVENMPEKNKKVLVEITEIGKIIDIKGDVITLKGMPGCVYGEILEFESGDKGIVIEFDEHKVIALLIGDGINIKTGEKAVSKGKSLEIAVSEDLKGRIVDGLAVLVDDRGPIKPETYSRVFKDAPPIMARVPISEPLKTGIKIVDALIPIGKGQRELIIGDRQTGKTSIVVDTILNQKDKDVICVYCWVGGSYSSMIKVAETLKKEGAMDYTVFVAAPASASSTEQYIAPYTAATIGEYFMDKKKDVLVIFDNLIKHAWIYRQISLLLNRSPGREAYPGDIFYVHSQLMERAGRMNPEIGGSMTFLPIVDTLQGDVTGYIQTNLISMTDGQIYTSTSLFNEGFKPAIDIGLSVSRIGSKVQSAALREVSRTIRLEYAQFRELQRLVQLRARISDKIAKKISRGQFLTEMLIQPVNKPVSEIGQILIFYAFSKNFINVMVAEQLQDFMRNIEGFIEEYDQGLMDTFKKGKELTKEIKAGLDKAFSAYLNG